MLYLFHRLTKAQQYGLYDTIEDAFSESHDTDTASKFICAAIVC